jgi:hypothetical protein
MANNKTPEPQKHPGWDVFAEMMPAAKSLDEARQHLTTMAVLEVLSNIVYDPDYTEDELYKCLKKEGYTLEKLEGSDQFYWLFK